MNQAFSMSHNVRDEGVGGSNPLTPTITSHNQGAPLPQHPPQDPAFVLVPRVLTPAMRKAMCKAMHEPYRPKAGYMTVSEKHKHRWAMAIAAWEAESAAATSSGLG